jgi:predicted helicase
VPLNKVKNSIHLVAISKIPIEEQKELKNQGITLISYLSNTYYVAIDSKFYSQSTVSKTLERQLQ